MVAQHVRTPASTRTGPLGLQIGCNYSIYITYIGNRLFRSDRIQNLRKLQVQLNNGDFVCCPKVGALDHTRGALDGKNASREQREALHLLLLEAKLPTV